MSVLVTGAAGFIGYHVSHALLAQGRRVIGVDNLNTYYNPALKHARLANLTRHKDFSFVEADIADHAGLAERLGAHMRVDHIIHLAAQAGVRYSLDHPFDYVSANVAGHLSLMELARHWAVDHFVYASSSSVYGRNTKTPFAETDPTDKPASLYGATKKADEVMTSAYAHLYQMPTTGLRFFTVYGPWGRPDMAYWIFTEKMLRGEPIEIFNHGKMARDFTYIADIVDGVLSALNHPPSAQCSHHQIFNLGNDHPEPLMRLVTLLEEKLGLTAVKQMRGMQKGDVIQTWADISAAKAAFGYAPKVSLETGLDHYVTWRKGLATGF
ncbi:MAG: NAD-dependent epimerase/dehydratase family protein [Pseudomonadota bacterium]